MRHIQSHAVPRSLACLLAGACAIMAAGARATPFELVYTGALNNQEALNLASDSTPTYFTDWTPFTIRALFDDTSSNLAPTFGGPFNGFRAYAPSSTTIDIAGTRYSVDSILANALAGVTVAIFDQNSFIPGRYGVGLIADPVGDGAGIIGDFVSASPNFTVGALTPAVFTGFAGAGHGSGACLSGSGSSCPHAVTPWVLHDSGGVAWNLTLGNFNADYPVAHSPGALTGPLNTARIVAGLPIPAVPEPSTYGLMLVGFMGLVWVNRRREVLVQFKCFPHDADDMT